MSPHQSLGVCSSDLRSRWRTTSTAREHPICLCRLQTHQQISDSHPPYFHTKRRPESDLTLSKFMCFLLFCSRYRCNMCHLRGNKSEFGHSHHVVWIQSLITGRYLYDLNQSHYIALCTAQTLLFCIKWHHHFCTIYKWRFNFPGE